MKNPIKTIAFKNLMAHTCATVVTVAPTVLSAAAIFTAFQFSDNEGVRLMSIMMSLMGGLLGQVFVGLNKLDSDHHSFNALYWKQKFANFEINSHKDDNEKKLLAVRHLLSPAINYQFTPADYQLVASIQISQHLDNLSFTQWREDLKYFADLSSNEGDLDKLTKISDLHHYINKTASKMDGARLQEIKNNLLERQAGTLSGEDTFSHLITASKKIEFDHATRVNEAVYNRARFLQRQNMKNGFDDRDYANFARIFEKGHEVVSYKSDTISSLIEFLTEFKSVVDWTRLGQSFRDSFKSDMGFFTKTMAQLQQLEVDNQDEFNKNQTHQRISTKIQNLRQITQGGFQNEPQSDRADNDERDTTSKKGETKTPSFIACDYVYFEGKNLPEKWAELRDNYAIVRDHSDKIEPRDLQDLHDTLNSCLPLLINADQNLSQFPNKNTEQKQKLLSDNLDLAITQVKDVANTLDLGVIKDLKVAMNYQTMKMNAR